MNPSQGALFLVFFSFLHAGSAWINSDQVFGTPPSLHYAIRVTPRTPFEAKVREMGGNDE